MTPSVPIRFLSVSATDWWLRRWFGCQESLHDPPVCIFDNNYAMPKSNDPDSPESLDEEKLGIGSQLAVWMKIRPRRSFKSRYATVLIAHFKSLDTSGINPTHGALLMAQTIAGKKPYECTWDNLYSLEKALIQIESDSDLIRHAWIVRSEYKELASESEWQEYISSKPPLLGAAPPNIETPTAPGNTSSIETKNLVTMLRCDLDKIQGEIHWRYIAIWAFSDYRKKVTMMVTWVAVGAVILSTGFTWLFASSLPKVNIAMIALILNFGVLGGMTSTIRRIQTLSCRGNPDLEIFKLGAGNIALYISPLFGGMFAGLLFLLFSGGLLTGAMFPEVSLDFVLDDTTVEGAKSAKLLVWMFLAGFAEQLVPDNLDKIAGESKQRE